MPDQDRATAHRAEQPRAGQSLGRRAGRLSDDIPEADPHPPSVGQQKNTKEHLSRQLRPQRLDPADRGWQRFYAHGPKQCRDGSCKERHVPSRREFSPEWTAKAVTMGENSRAKEFPSPSESQATHLPMERLDPPRRFHPRWRDTSPVDLQRGEFSPSPRGFPRRGVLIPDYWAGTSVSPCWRSLYSSIARA